MARLRLVGEIQSEINAGRIGRVAAIGREGAKGFVTAFAGELVGGGHDTTGARAAAAKGDTTDAQTGPVVFGESGAAANDEGRAETIHRDGHFADGDETVVELRE